MMRKNNGAAVCSGSSSLLYNITALSEQDCADTAEVRVVILWLVGLDTGQSEHSSD